MIQQTSLVAFAEIRAGITIRHKEILNIFQQSTQSLTNMEISTKLGWSINRVTPRVYELRKLGYLELEEQRPCGQTGRLAMAWRQVK